MRRGTSADRVDLLEETPHDTESPGYGTHISEDAAVFERGVTNVSCCRRCLRSAPIQHVMSWWRTAVVVLTPLLLLPVPLLWKDQVSHMSIVQHYTCTRTVVLIDRIREMLTCVSPHHHHRPILPSQLPATSCF